MAISQGANNGEDAVSEMNTTPLIDVMLVLLIMFMLSIPMATHASKVDNPSPPKGDKAVLAVRHEVGVTFDSKLLWDQQPIEQLALFEQFRAIARLQVDQQPDVLLRPDPYSRYETVARVVAGAQTAGITKLGFAGNEDYGSL